MNNIQIGLLMLLLTALGVIGYNVWLRETTPPAISYTAFLTDLDKGDIKKVHLKGGEITGENKKGQRFSAFSPDVAGLMPLLVVNPSTSPLIRLNPGLADYSSRWFPSS